MRKIGIVCLVSACIIASFITYLYYAHYCMVYVVDVRMKVASSSASCVSKIYFSPNRNFFENMSRSQKVLSDNKYHDLSFTLTGAPIKTIRFDIIDRPGVVFVKSIVVKTKGGKLLRNMFNNKPIKANQVAELQHGKSLISIRTTQNANDPYVELVTNLPKISESYFFASLFSSIGELVPIFLKFFFLLSIFLYGIIRVTIP